NVPKEKVKQWPARDVKEISSDDPYEIAADIALNDWSYSDEAVVAVIDSKNNIEKTDIKNSGILKGTLPANYNIDFRSFNMEEPAIGVGGNYQPFEINRPYKYIVAHMYWPNVVKDLDLQIYDDQLGMTDASSNWNIFYGAGETVSSYVYHYGKWEIGVTYMPTQSLLDDGKMRSMYQNVDNNKYFLSNLGIKSNKNLVNVNVRLYPGIEITLNKSIPFGCRNAEFKLKWSDPNIALGFVILDPSGAETASAPSDDEIVNGVEKGITERIIHLEKLGETTEKNSYRICVFSLDNISAPLDFSIQYSWHQNFSREGGDAFASATEGSILASVLDAPLLYVSTDNVPEITAKALYKLGVRHIYFLNLGNHASSQVLENLRGIAKVREFKDYRSIYDEIKERTGSNDVVFSTIDPWTYYYANEDVPKGEYPGALFIGPAAYIAAHHGTPVLIVDNHPELSQSVVWHTQFWIDTANISFRPKLPSVSCMVLTGRTVMNFLRNYGYKLPKDRKDLESMITVADQFDIGPTWDRTFTGALIPGRFSGSPVDTAYWIARDVFYPCLIFVNPAMNPEGITLINGSKSIIKPYIGRLKPPLGSDLVIIKPSEEEKFTYPILHTYDVYLYKFNEKASKHWGGMYTCANGITPYVTPSPNPIDVDVTDKVGAYYPDIDSSEVTPNYGKKAGYDNVFSTNFSAIVDNLNKGTILWMEICHGSSLGYGSIGTWNTESPYVKEPNPWRGYEVTLLYPKNWYEFLKLYTDDEHLKEFGIKIPHSLISLGSLSVKPLDMLFGLVMVDKGCTENPDVAVTNPDIPIPSLADAFGVDFHIKESHGLSLIPIIGRRYRAYSDGIVIDPLPGGENVLSKATGIMFDDKLDNLHSCGINAGSCLIAHTYLHTTFIRHGSAYQIMDPWSTSWYSSVWFQFIPRDFALGYTVGQTYEHGMSLVGVEYLVDQWWWDLNENVVYYGDPDLRPYVPSTEYSDANHWEQKDVQPLRYDSKAYVDGHMLYGATSHPH
ncbi:MAG: hypothetical protein J7K13_01825, partial [Thermoplasmata archaeon]|nr:hypothetical protein [Thermoplasmata archaeon]